MYFELVFEKMKDNYPDINTSILESNMSEEEKESLDNALNYSGDMQAVQKDTEE